MGFDVGLQDQTDPEYEIADNMAVNLVDAIRSDMVGNEEAFLLANAAYATGLSPRTETYNAIQIQGSSGAGKSDLKQRVDELWPNGWLLRLSDTSEKGLIDDQRWNDVYVFAGDEQNKLPSSAIEILKSSFGDDGDEDGWGYTYTRNTSQQDDDEDTTEFKKQTLPFVTLIADENEQKANQIALEHPEMYVGSPSGTGSMSPGISSQSMIIYTTEFNERTLTPGQIVSYNVEGRESNIIHRVHDVESQEDGGICYIMKGDANPRVDGKCVEPENMEYLALGTIFRKTGGTSICREELQYGPESQYCPT